MDWEQPAAAWREFSDLDDEVDLAGWFFIEGPQDGFSALPDLFPEHSAGLSHTTCGADSQYLFVGEERIRWGEVLRPLVEASRRYPQGRGWLTLLDRPAMPQYGIAAGNVYELAALDPSAWPFHPDIQFNTGRFGYEPRETRGIGD